MRLLRYCRKGLSCVQMMLNLNRSIRVIMTGSFLLVVAVVAVMVEILVVAVERKSQSQSRSSRGRLRR